MEISERIRQEFSGAWAIAKKNIRIYYLKSPVLIFGIFFPFFLFLAFALGRNISPISLFPGILSLAVFFTSSSIGPVIAPWETRMRTLERLICSPLSLKAILLGDILSGSIFGMIIAMVPASIGILSIGINLSHPWIFGVTITLSALCFSSLGILLSSPPTDNPSNVMMLSNLIRLPLIFISGIFVPLHQLPLWGRKIALISPLSYTNDLMIYSISGNSFYSLSLDIIVLSGFTVLFFTLAIIFHSKNIERRL